MQKDVEERPARENPKQFLLRMRDKRVSVTLKWGQVYEGCLVSSDNYFNILLRKCVEIDGEARNEVGDVSIRCNNVRTISEG